jgi:DNA-binding NtrC family response regulator
MLAHHILTRLQPEPPPVHLSPKSVELLQRLPWPGNVRQLESVLLRALVLFGKLNQIADDDVHRALALELEPQASDTAPSQRLFCPRPAPPGWFWDEVWKPFKEHRLERQAVLDLLAETLQETGGYYTRVADRFGISRREYQKFIDFLTHSDLRLDFRPYRQSGSGTTEQDPAGDLF